MKLLRQESGISQETLAELSGLDRTFISLLERGLRTPSLGTLEKIASALRMPLSTLIIQLENVPSQWEVEFTLPFPEIDLSIIEHMLNGMAYCRMIFKDGRPVDWIYLYTNATFEELTGLADVVGKRVSEVIPDLPETNPELFEIYGRISKGGASEMFETHLPQLGMWLSVTVYSPKIEHFVAMFQVITDRKSAELELSRVNARLSLAQRASHAGTWDWDVSTGKVHWTDELFHIFGVDKGTTEASFDAWRGLVHPEDMELAETRIQKAIADHEQLLNEYRIITHKGELKWIQALGEAQYDDAGNVLRMTGICIDITERKRAQ